MGEALSFSEGLAGRCRWGDGTCSGATCSCKRRNAIPEPLYRKLPSPREKVPKVRGGQGWGYIDRQGKMVIPPGFDYAGSFSGGLAEIRKKERQGYIDTSGKVVWESKK